MACLPKRCLTLLEMWGEAATATTAPALPAATRQVFPAATPRALPAAAPPAAPTEIFVGGVSLAFPFPPYPSQICIANQMIRAFKLRKHALLESPTGTGKSLAILISSLAWLEFQKALVASDELGVKRSAEFDSVDGARSAAASQDDDVFQPEKVVVKRSAEFDTLGDSAALLPRIYICSRTHAQLSQLIKGLKSTKYTPSMAVLGSREQMCIHPSVKFSLTKNEDCSKLIGGADTNGCSFYSASNIMANHSAMHGVWDIEDIVAKGQSFRACPYFTAKEIAHRSDVVFCPYNFLIDKLIRESTGIELKNNIVIIDEAHNLEDQCREAASFSVTVSLIRAVIEMIDVCKHFPNCPAAAEEIKAALSQISNWIQRCKVAMSSDVSGDKLLEFVADQVPSQFNSIGLSCEIVKALAIKAGKLQEWHEKVIEHSDAPGAFRWVCSGDGIMHSMVPSFMGSMRAIKMILLVVGYAHEHAMDYAICMRQQPKDIEAKVHIWCLNPAIAFKDLREQCRSVVLISGACSTMERIPATAGDGLSSTLMFSTGTLSPMDSFSSELGCEFSIRLQAPHVIDCARQVECMCMKDFNLSFTGSSSPILHQRLGQLIIDVCTVTPNGVLVFCSSYWWIEMLNAAWHKNGQWHTLNSIKTLFFEPKVNDKKFPKLLKDFEAAACTSKGAVMFAVCRGKICEGMDLSDRYS